MCLWPQVWRAERRPGSDRPFREPGNQRQAVKTNDRETASFERPFPAEFRAPPPPAEFGQPVQDLPVDLLTPSADLREQNNKLCATLPVHFFSLLGRNAEGLPSKRRGTSAAATVRLRLIFGNKGARVTSGENGCLVKGLRASEVGARAAAGENTLEGSGGHSSRTTQYARDNGWRLRTAEVGRHHTATARGGVHKHSGGTAAAGDGNLEENAAAAHMRMIRPTAIR